MSGEGSSGSAAGEEEQDSESSSSSSNIQGMEQLLENFRQQWQRELEPSQTDPAPSSENTSSTQDNSDSNSKEATARKWFLQGVKLEGQRKLHEAISCYRRAVQLVPDIEFRIYTREQRSSQQHTPQHTSRGSSERESRQNNESEEPDEDLIAKFQQLLCGAVCSPDHDPRGPGHISRLPPELLLLLLRWVVAADLDVRSLENCSQVSRGFYLAARDSEIWRLICARVWGPQSVGLKQGADWRSHFILSPRVMFHGCYISCTSYIRPGEHSFQDACYHLWHAVEYYRYIRFFPGGRVLMLTSPDEPAASVGQLRYRTSRNPAVLSGVYRLSGTNVVLEVRPPPPSNTSADNINNNNRFRRRRQQEVQHDSGEKTFHAELEIVPFKNRNNIQLCWRRYKVETKYKSAPSSFCTFDMCPSKFPPFWFSRVKSYVVPAEECL